jgi:hypothetical protein
MGFRKKSRDENFANDGMPERILALDGGTAGQRRRLDVKQERGSQRGE